MPTAPKRACVVPGCPGFAEYRGRCRAHARRHEVTRQPERTRGQKWMDIRAQVLRHEPLCRVCWAQHVVEPATVVDHVVPLARGGTDAWTNLQPLCQAHHDEKSARERGARLTGGSPNVGGHEA